MIPRRHEHTRAVFLTAALLSAFITLTADNASARQTTPPASASTSALNVPLDRAKDLVLLTVSVTDKHGRFVTGLGRDSFKLFEGKAQPELAFFSDEEIPQSVGVVFDISNSMGRLALDEARGALVRFMRQAHTSNEYFVTGFGDEVHLLADWTRDGKTLIEALNKLGHIKNKKSETVFNDAVAAALEKVSRGPQPRRVLIVVSDGGNTISKTTLARVRDTLKRSDVTVYTAAISEGSRGVADYPADWRLNLEELAADSGGKAFFPTNPAEIAHTFARIGLELHSQYTLGFVPEPPRRAREEWRKLKVKVALPQFMVEQGAGKAYVRGREGYYAAAK